MVLPHPGAPRPGGLAPAASAAPLAAAPVPVPAADPAGIEELLQSLGGRLRRGASVAPEAELPRWPTGLAELDRQLGGGLPRGRLSEIAGPASGGRTSLAHALLARVTAAGEVAALVELADAFDPDSAHAAGVRLERVLWVRAPDRRAALRSVEHLLVARGFGLVLLDLTGASAGPAQARRRPAGERAPAVRPRLRKAAGASGAALVVLAEKRVLGACADLALETEPLRPRFTGSPALLEGTEGEVNVRKNRFGPQLTRVPVQWGGGGGLRVAPGASKPRPAVAAAAIPLDRTARAHR